MGAQLNIGIIGCADIAKKYGIKAFQALDAVGEIFIASRDRDKCAAVAKAFHVRAKESYEALIHDPTIHAVYIPLPIGLHEEWAVKAAAAGKHILCEKSLSGNLTSVKEIIAACRTHRVVLFENFMCDYHPQHARVLSLLRAHEVGTVCAFKGYFGFPYDTKGSFRYDRRLGGGGLNDAGAYPVFMARKILESEPLAVTCALETAPGHGVDIRGSAYLQFPEHKTAFVAFGFDNAYQNNYSVWGSTGCVSVDRAYSIPPERSPSIVVYTNAQGKETAERIAAPAANHFELIFADFCATVLNGDGAKREAKYAQILAQARVLEAMRISAEHNATIHTETIH